jgi:hypothetical protein
VHIKFVDFNDLINNVVRFKVDSDLKKYEITNNNLKNKFVIYRLCSEILNIINQSIGKKIIFYFNLSGSYNLEFCTQEQIDVVFRNLSKYLKLNSFREKYTLKELEHYYTQNTGESKELRHRIESILCKNRKNINIEGLYKFLAKKQIYKIQDTLNNTVKLGIFIT